MKTYKTLEEARAAADRFEGVEEIAEVDHKKEGRIFVLLKVGIETYQIALKNNPKLIPEIPHTAVIKGYPTNATLKEDERQARISAITGMPEMRRASDKLTNATDRYRAAQDRGYGSNYPAKEANAMSEAQKQYDACKAKYPQAWVYRKAQSWIENAHWSNTEKTAAGKRACERILNGEDWQIVLADMDAEWSAAASAAVDRQ